MFPLLLCGTMANPPRAGALQLLKSLERGLRGAEIEAYQHQRLVDIARYARATTHYYKAGLDAFLSRKTFDRASWSKVPILTREAVRAHRQGLMVSPQAMPPDAGPVRSSTTSGTSGEPLEFRINRLADIFSQIKYRAYFTDWDIKVTERVLTARTPKTHELASAGQLVRKPVPGGGEECTIFSLAIDKVLEAAASVRPNYLRTYPGVALQCAIEARRRNLELTFDRIMTVGETLDADTQSFVEQAFSCRVADAYATTEFGLVASGCPRCGNYHVSHEGLFVELLDEMGEPVGNGASGRVVVTSLYGYAMPLIRYELSDFAIRVAGSRSCKDRGLTIGRIMGRRRGMFRLPSGGLIWPYIPASALHELGVTGYQVTQLTQSEVRVRYASVVGLQSDVLVELVRRFISPDYIVAVEHVAELPSAPSGKRQVFESLVP